MSRGALLLALALLGGCRPTPPADDSQANDPSAVALRLFELARGSEPDAAELERLFPDVGSRTGRAALQMALDELGRVPPPRVHAVAPLDDVGRVVVDLVAESEAGARASYTVQLAPSGDGWRVHWISGPGVSWPPHAARRPGLATSGAPPSGGSTDRSGVR